MRFKNKPRSKDALDQKLCVICDLIMTSLLSNFQKMIRISYTFHTNLKIKKSQFLILFCIDLSTVSYATGKIIT